MDKESKEIMDTIMDMSNQQMIDKVKEGVRGKFTLHVPHDITQDVISALRILAFDIMYQDGHLISSQQAKELNKSAGFNLLEDFTSVWDCLSESEDKNVE